MAEDTKVHIAELIFRWDSENKNESHVCNEVIVSHMFTSSQHWQQTLIKSLLTEIIRL